MTMFNPARYPKGGAVRPKRGLNLQDNMFEVRSDEATILKNVLWVGNSLLQRSPFRNLSDTDFTADGVFRGAHDYQPPGAAARLLWYSNSGKIKQRVAAGTESDLETSLSTGLEAYFSTVFDAVAFVNGSNTPRIIRDSAIRQMGSPAAVSTLVAAASGAGSLTGTRLHIVIPVIESGGVGVVFANWSNITSTVAASDAQFDLTWTDVVDTRVSAYYVFGTKLVAGGTLFYSLGRVLPTVQAFTDNFADADLPVIVSQMPDKAPLLDSWGPPPISKLVAFSGNRMVYGNIPAGSLQNALQTSQVAATSFEAEGVPADGSTLIRALGSGDLTCIYAIGETGEGSQRSNDLFVSQVSACYILPETNTDLPLKAISDSIGCIGQRAIAQDGPFLFFQSRRGVEFWPGVGRDIYLLSDKIQPIFDGGGNQALSANQSDEDIRYRIAKNQLWITIRDSGLSTGGNKAYCMDLLKFRREFNPINPALAARFTGPIENAALGFGLFLRRLDDSLVLFDNENSRILKYDEDGDQDEIAGVDTNMPVIIQGGPLLKEDPISQKTLMYAHILQFTNSITTIKMLAEFERVISEGEAEPNSYALEWADIDWSDMEWSFDSWYSEMPFEFGEVSAKWFVPRIEKTDSTANYAYFGLVLWFWAFDQIRTFK